MDSYLVKCQTLINAFARERRSQRQQEEKLPRKRSNKYICHRNPKLFFYIRMRENGSPIISESIFNSKRFTDKIPF